MAKLLVLQGPGSGREFRLDERPLVLGRQPGVDLRLDAPEVSRNHARVTFEDQAYFIEDLGSSNGTFVNSKKLAGKSLLNERDQIKIGPCLILYEPDEETADGDPDVVIRGEVTAHTSNLRIFTQDATQKLQNVLEIARNLARSLDLDEVLPRFLEHLLKLYPQADRGLILLKEGDHLVVRAIHSRRDQPDTGPTYSRTVVKRVMEEGIGIVAEDARADSRFVATQTLNQLGIRSFLCVPFKDREDRTLGVLQVDRFRLGMSFTEEDLNMLTAIALQASVVLENAALHDDLLQQDRMKRDLALAREIQNGFLPQEMGPLAAGKIDLYAQVFPAREVSGDFYDYFTLDDHRVAFCVGDVSGKGIPAALFMIAVRTLSRHVGATAQDPALVLQMLNDTLAADNPTGMFATIMFGVFDANTGSVSLCSGGHPPPVLRRRGEAAQTVLLPPGRLLGFASGELRLTNTLLRLGPGDVLLLYTDGITEALAPDRQTMFGDERFLGMLQNLAIDQPLADSARNIKLAVDRFTASDELHDDMTLLLLRRPG